MFDSSPKPLPDHAIIDGFTPDVTLAWLVAYAGPCGEPDCSEPHTRLYLIPMVGWLHAMLLINDVEELRLRPAIMSSGGAVVDYLSNTATFRLIAVLRATEDASEVARGIYKEKFGGEMIVEPGTQPLQN